MTDDAEAQEDEMTALRSILIDDDGGGGGEEGAEDAAATALVLERVEGSGLWRGRISVAAEMVKMVTVTTPGGSFSVSHLPPVALTFTLPPDYPSKSPPEYKLECRWMTEEQVSKLSAFLDAEWSDSVGCPVIYTWRQILQEEALTVAVKNDALDLTEVYDGAVRERKAVIEAAKMPTCLKQAGLAGTVVEGRRTDDIGVVENIGERAKSSEPCDESGFKLGGSQSSASSVIQLEWKVGAAEEREYMIAVAEAKRAHNRQGPSKKSRQRDGASDAEGAIGGTGSEDLRKQNEDLAEHEVILAAARKVCENIEKDGVSRKYLDGVVQKWNPRFRTGFISERTSGQSYFFKRQHVISPDSSTSAKMSKGWGVSFTVGNKVPAAGRKPEAEYVFLLDDDWSNSTTLAVMKEVSGYGKGLQENAPSNLRVDSDFKVLVDDNGDLVKVTKSDEKEGETDSSVERDRGAEEEKYEPEIVRYLKNYDVEQKQRDFDKESFSCGVCFEDKLGRKCTQFEECGHVFCRDCMAEYFRVQIREGQVNALNCPTTECETQASHHQIRALVSSQLFDTFERQQLEATLQSMSDIALCPRVICQCPVIVERESNMGRCPACEFAFCIYCKASFHGLDPCKINSAEHKALLQEYLGADATRKAAMEKRYGARQLSTMAANFLSESYKSTNAKPCPNCRAPIEKSDGCNKMTCFKCQTNFCYICGAKLNRETPYAHFSDPSQECFNLLFEGVDPVQYTFIVIVLAKLK